MYNLLLVEVECPRCKAIIHAESEFKMGYFLEKLE